jgi:large subunit ribosomal protein L18
MNMPSHSTKNVYVSRYRRKRERKTDYRRRLKLLLSGFPRLVVRQSNKYISAQIVIYENNGDRTVAEFSSKNLVKFGWKGDEDNIAAAFLTGLALAKLARESGFSADRLVPDLGMHSPHKGGKLFALLMGASEGGLPITVGEEALLDESMLRMEQLAKYASELKNKDQKVYAQRFSRYLERGLEPEKLPAHFDEIRKNLGAQNV